METIQFSDELRIGIEDLDSHHQHLFSLFNSFWNYPITPLVVVTVAAEDYLGIVEFLRAQGTEGVFYEEHLYPRSRGCGDC